MHYKNWPNDAGFNALGDTRQKIELQVSGRFPDYVSGSLYRTGPGGYRVPREKPEDGEVSCSHWFDGFTTVHKFDLTPNGRNTRVWYSSYCQVDEAIERARKDGKLTGITFAQKRDPCDTLYQKLKSAFEPTILKGPHTANIGVTLRNMLPSEIAQLPEGEKTLSKHRVMTVATDNISTKQFDMDTLEPLGVTRQVQLHPSLTGPMSAAHSAKDPETGDVYNYNLEFGYYPTYRIFKASQSTGEVSILATIAGADIRGAYIHSMFLTRNFVVLCIWPAFYSAMGASILWTRNILDSISPFDPDASCVWLAIDRRHGRGLVKKFTSPAMFSFHTTNAWETPSSSSSSSSSPETEEVDITCELAQFANTDILHRFYYENMLSTSPSAGDFSSNLFSRESQFQLARYTLSSVPLFSSSPSSPHIDPSIPTSSVPSAEATQTLSIPGPHAGDLPNINPNFATKPHRYVWGVADTGRSSFLDTLVKTDTLTGRSREWSCEGHTPGEPIFIPDPEGKGEDDGVILVVVLDGFGGTSYLLCLDAGDMKEVARAEVGRAVGFGFHGLHLPHKL